MGSAAPEIIVSTTCRILLKDLTTKMSFLIDTGADVSVLPPTVKQRSKLKNESYPIKLFAANRTEIRTYGTQFLQLNFGLRRNFSWIFLIADVTHPILGSDFLMHHHLLPDLKNRVLIDGTTNLSYNQSISISHIQKDDSVYKQILQEFQEIVSINSSLKCNKETKPFHFIETTGDSQSS